MPKHPKRSKRSEKSEKSEKLEKSGKGSEKIPTAAATAKDEKERKDGKVHERGAFAIARCDRCGWEGAARRSRERARKDLDQHLEDKPKHADHVSLEAVRA